MGSEEVSTSIPFFTFNSPSVSNLEDALYPRELLTVRMRAHIIDPTQEPPKNG